MVGTNMYRVSSLNNLNSLWSGMEDDMAGKDRTSPASERRPDHRHTQVTCNGAWVPKSGADATSGRVRKAGTETVKRLPPPR
jgi:hypothetical protein